MQVEVAEAKARFSELVKRAEAGEEIAIMRGGTIVARIVAPVVPANTLPRVGALKGKVRIADDFDAPLAQFTSFLK